MSGILHSIVLSTSAMFQQPRLTDVGDDPGIPGGHCLEKFFSPSLITGEQASGQGSVVGDRASLLARWSSIPLFVASFAAGTLPSLVQRDKTLFGPFFRAGIWVAALLLPGPTSPRWSFLPVQGYGGSVSRNPPGSGHWPNPFPLSD